MGNVPEESQGCPIKMLPEPSEYACEGHIYLLKNGYTSSVALPGLAHLLEHWPKD